MTRPKLTLFYDTISPYSWLGFEMALRYRSIWDIELDLVPFFLGAVMAATENKPPASNPIKGKYLFKDLAISSKMYGLPPFRLPKEFPTNSLKAQRILTLLKMRDGDKLADASRALWKSYWVDGKSLADDQSLLQTLSPVLGTSVTQQLLAEALKSPEAKKTLTEATERALASGSFGAPWFVLEQTKPDGKKYVHTFWGSDRGEAIASVLGKPYYGVMGKPVNPSARL